MARKILLVIVLITLFLIPIITASTTEITVKTRPDHKLLITALKPGEIYLVIQSFPPYKNTGILGEVKYTLTTSEPNVNIKLELINTDSTPDMNYTLEDIPTTGEPVFIYFFPGNVTFTVGNPVVANVTNITSAESNITNSTNETSVNQTTPATVTIPPILNESNITISKSNFSITGYASQFYENNSKTFLYVFIVIGIIVGVLIIIFIVRKIPRKSSDHYVIRHKPLETSSSPQNPSLIHAERKLKEAQQEIESIKKRNEEIRDAERKIQEDSIRLERLKRGY